MTKEFYVHTEDLKKVAGQIQDLLDLIQSDDATKGTPHDLQSSAGSIDGPTATFWSGPNAFATTYGRELTYVSDTYQKLVQQLGAVMTACTNTANQYQGHETQTKQDVNNTSDAPILGQ